MYVCMYMSRICTGVQAHLGKIGVSFNMGKIGGKKWEFPEKLHKKGAFLIQLMCGSRAGFPLRA